MVIEFASDGDPRRPLGSRPGHPTDRRPAPGLVDPQLGRDPVAQGRNVTDHPDGPPAVLKLVEDGHDVLEALVVETAETLVDEQGM